MIQEPFYDPEKSYYDNYNHGPFGAFTDGQKIERLGEPTETFLGHKVYTRFGIPAGPLLNAKYVKAALDKGFDLPIYKTVRSGEHESHAHPNVLPVEHYKGDLTLEQAEAGVTIKDVYETPLSITNSFGVPSYHPEIWQEDAAEAVRYAKEGQLVGLSFQGTKWDGETPQQYEADWVTVAKLAAETKAPYLEANLSCPNEGTKALLCFDVERVSRLSRAIKESIGDTPLFLKISFFQQQADLEALVKEVGDVVQGFATINTIASPVRTAAGEQALPGEGRLVSGICGHSIKWAGLDMVTRLKALREQNQQDFTIIGVGGVTLPEDYTEYLDHGADAVMSATGAMWHPHLGEKIYKLQN